MNHIVWIVFDSARWDSFAAAKTPNLDRIGAVERRFSYASWTPPSHYAFLMGVTPHRNPRHEFASRHYRDDVARWCERVGLSDTSAYDGFLPALSLPRFLSRLGYRCEAYVSLPVLNPHTMLARDFDAYQLMSAHNDLAAIVAGLRFADQPMFYFINTGETHYPYLLSHETESDLPRISGLHGAYRELSDFLSSPSSSPDWFDAATMKALWHKQVACIEHLDRVIGTLLERAPANVWFIVTSDHGELFGEDGFFGHGPIMHEKVFEVFFVEGLHP